MKLQKTLESSHDVEKKNKINFFIMERFALAAGFLIEKLSKHGYVQKKSVN